MRKPLDTFELLVWERYYAEHLGALADFENTVETYEKIATLTDLAFEEFGRRRDEMLARIEAERKKNKG